MNVQVIIPAFNEEETVHIVVRRLLETSCAEAQIEKIVVVDNASTDNTRSVAESAGAVVVYEAEQGYGAACLRGMEETRSADIVLFIDADGSDHPEEWPQLVVPIVQGRQDFVVGSRVIGGGTLLSHQRFGNWLASFLLSWIYGARLTDLGPFRAIRASTLYNLGMQDRDFGWTVEMEIRALRQGIHVHEEGVSYRERLGGESKIAGTLRGSFLAGKKILQLIFQEVVSLWLEKIQKVFSSVR